MKHDPSKPHSQLLTDVLDGLRARPRAIPSKYFYDARGSALFEQITELPEYYPTVTELGILDDALPELARRVGPGAAIIEYGSGSGIKTRRLLRALDKPASYTPIEISAAALDESVAALRAELPGLQLLPVCADYTAAPPLPDALRAHRRVVFFPGSTLGNFTTPQSIAFLRQIHDQIAPDGALILGLDLKKDPALLHAAYNDAQGTTAAFNLNLLARLNVELGADFALDQWHHYAAYSPTQSRVEMYLIAACAQTVTIDGHRFEFEEGEPILTEYSHKYTRAELARLAAEANLRLVHTWTDPASLFSLSWLEPA
jgi:L-histidine Nalpha-methyltransferase